MISIGCSGSYGRDDVVRPAQHITRCDAERADTLRGDPPVAPCVSKKLIAVQVAVSVDLHRQTRGFAVEVEDVGADRVLSSEAQAGLSLSECDP